eukprot:scaffold239187_cov17-Prasinocladus_malaysianus.AAC.1
MVCGTRALKRTSTHTPRVCRAILTLQNNTPVHTGPIEVIGRGHRSWACACRSAGLGKLTRKAATTVSAEPK